MKMNWWSGNNIWKYCLQKQVLKCSGRLKKKFKRWVILCYGNDIGENENSLSCKEEVKEPESLKRTRRVKSRKQWRGWSSTGTRKKGDKRECRGYAFIYRQISQFCCRKMRSCVLLGFSLVKEELRSLAGMENLRRKEKVWNNFCVKWGKHYILCNCAVAEQCWVLIRNICSWT